MAPVDARLCRPRRGSLVERLLTANDHRNCLSVSLQSTFTLREANPCSESDAERIPGPPEATMAQGDVSVPILANEISHLTICFPSDKTEGR
jgi:hypothetical protein